VKNSDKDGKEYGCMNGCIYKKKDDSNSGNYFCFKKGSLPVTCTINDSCNIKWGFGLNGNNTRCVSKNTRVNFNWSPSMTHNVNYIGMQGSSSTRAGDTAQGLYMNCVDSPPGLHLPSGNKLNTVPTRPPGYAQTLDEEGTYYFYCGVPGHCKGGVKIQINVQDDCPEATKCTNDQKEDYCSVTWTFANSEEGKGHNICVEEGKEIRFSWNGDKEKHNVNYIGMKGGSVGRGSNNQQQHPAYFYSTCDVPSNSVSGGYLPSGQQVNTQAEKPDVTFTTRETAGTYYYYSAYKDDCKKGLRANVTVVDNLANCPSTSTPCPMPVE